MKVKVKVTSTHEHVLDIGTLKPGFIHDLIYEDKFDGSFLGGTDWSLDEMSIGDTVYEIVSVDVEPVGAKK